MKIETSRFGALEVDKKDILFFQEGLLGFENLKKYFVVDPGDKTLILWLQSVDDAKIAFPILEPKIFKLDYVVRLLPIELKSLELENLSHASVYSVLTISSDVAQMSANLKAPIVINNQTKVARQVVLQDNKLEVRYPMYKELKTYILGNASDDSVRTRVEACNFGNTTPDESSQMITIDVELDLEQETVTTSNSKKTPHTERNLDA